MQGSDSVKNSRETMETHCNFWLGELELIGRSGDGIDRRGNGAGLDEGSNLLAYLEGAILDLGDIISPGRLDDGDGLQCASAGHSGGVQDAVKHWRCASDQVSYRVGY